MALWRSTLIRGGMTADRMPLGLLRRPAAVDEKVGAGDVARVIGREINRQLSDLFRLAPAAQRNFGNELLVQFGILEYRRVQFGGERPRTDPIDGDFFGSEFERERAGEAEQGGLAGTVGRAPGEGYVAHN